MDLGKHHNDELSRASSATETGAPFDVHDSLAPRTQYLLREEDDVLSRDKFCRICLEEDNPTDMIAPCLCKGSSRWVHRSCLNLWRQHESDRAFSQCTECQFRYHFVPTRARTVFWSRTLFCLLASRDFVGVTLVVQLLIGLFGYVIMTLDGQGYLINLLDGEKDCVDHTDTASFLWCHHQLSGYYLYGLFCLLICLGLFGSVVLCRSGCRIPTLPSGRDDYVELTDVAPNDQQGNRQRANFYRRRRHRDACCRRDPCCLGDPCIPLQYGDDCCCCCCDGTTSQSSESDCSCGDCCCPSGGGAFESRGSSCDGTHVLIAILLIVLVVMAIIGFFVGVFFGVLICQRILQRHFWLIRKKQLVEEFQVASHFDPTQPTGQPGPESIYAAPPLLPPRLEAKDAANLRRLGLLFDEE